MKRLISMAMTAVMALTLVVAAAPVVANAAQPSTDPVKSTSTVSYEHSKEVTVDNADYAVQIPAAITFTSVGQTIEADVNLVYAADQADNAGKVYGGNHSVQVAITSDGAFELVNGTETLEYDLKYDTVDVTDGNFTVILSKDKTTSDGFATLPNAPTVAGTYTDVLTYTITHQAQ